jgi:hypothetical protein
VDEPIKKEPVHSASVVVSMISAEKVDAISYMEKPISNQLDKVKTFINKNRR